MFWKRFFIVIGILVILAFVAQLLAAPYVKGLVIKGLKDSLGVDVTIGDCAVSVLKRKVILDDVTVLNPDRKDDYLLKAKRKFSAPRLMLWLSPTALATSRKSRAA